MKYNSLTTQEIGFIFATDMLGWEWTERYDLWEFPEKAGFLYDSDWKPLTNLDHAFLGVEKLRKKYTVEIVGENNWMVWLHALNDTAAICYDDNLNAAIVEACIRIVRPELFTED